MSILFFQTLKHALKIFNFFFTSVFILEAGVKGAALGFTRYMKDRSAYFLKNAKCCWLNYLVPGFVSSTPLSQLVLSLSHEVLVIVFDLHIKSR